MQLENILGSFAMDPNARVFLFISLCAVAQAFCRCGSEEDPVTYCQGKFAIPSCPQDRQRPIRSTAQFCQIQWASILGSILNLIKFNPLVIIIILSEKYAEIYLRADLCTCDPGEACLTQAQLGQFFGCYPLPECPE